MLRARAIALGLALLAGGCGSCGRGGPVPFKRDAGGGHGKQPGDTAADGPPKPFTPVEGRVLPEGTTRVDVEGSPIDGAGKMLRAVLPVDLDQDGDRDALVVTAGDRGEAGLAVSRRNGDAFAALAPLAHVEPTLGCEVTGASIRQVSAHFAVAGVERTCAQTGVERAFWITALERAPRVLERVTLLPPAGRWDGQIAVGMRAVDHDGDGYEDAVLDVTITPKGMTDSVHVALPWLNRPGGLARDTHQPEGRLLELTTDAHAKLRHDPAAALVLAEQALAVHDALCREGGGPRLRFDGADGLSCGRSTGAGRAAAIEAIALAKQGKVLEAIDAFEALDGPGMAVPPSERHAAQHALGTLPTPAGLHLTEVTTFLPPRTPAVRLSALAFDGEGTLLLRGTAPKTVDLQTKQMQPADPGGGGVLMRDPSGRLAVADVHRTCDGEVLSIVPASSIVAGVVTGRPLSEPLLEPRAPPAGAPCPNLPESARNDDDGWRVLGWAPQGVVAVRGEEMRVVPLTVDGKPAGPPDTLTPDTPPPAPLPAGAAATDAHAWVEATPWGVVLRTLSPHVRTVLLRPDGWTDAHGTPSDAAISPKGDRVAVMRGNQVYVIDGITP